ncbi:MAG: hypothetical protein GY847_36250 [Proteobacteria bacterium]|nr:hypothetical protein [Pseudomonadota bacterium]
MTSTNRKERTRQMTLCLFPKINIPPDWTGAQAKAIVDLLDEISTAVWDTHESQILDVIKREESLLKRAAGGVDNEWPF